MAKTRLILIATAFAALALPGVGDAQSPASASDQPVMWGGDLFEYTADGFALTGRAEILQGGNRLRANRINAFTTNGDLTRVEAMGDVYFVTPEQTMRGDRAVYTLTDDQVTVTGDVILTQDKNVVTGGRLVYNIRTESARMEGAGGAGGRVQGVFYPQGN